MTPVDKELKEILKRLDRQSMSEHGLPDVTISTYAEEISRLPKYHKEKDWVCQIRPGNPHYGGRLGPEDFFRPKSASHIVFEEGIFPEVFAPPSGTIILKNKGFVAVKDYVYSRPEKLGPTHRSSTTSAIHICLPERVQGREVIFYSPNINPLAIK